MAAMHTELELYHRLWEKIERVRFGMLTTWDPELGVLRSRPMTNQKVEFDGSLWFFTSDETSATREIDRQHEVNISYAKPDDDLFVSVSGIATIVRDKQRMHDLWQPVYKAWFPQGLEDPHLVLIRVQVTAGEYWDSASGKMTQLIALAKAVVTGKSAYDIGEHGKVGGAAH